MTSLSLALRKNFKTFQKKSFNFQDRWENFILGNFSWRVSAETWWDASCFKKVYWKSSRVFQTLNRCIIQISLNYIKLVIPKILFILVIYAILVFTSKYQNKNFWLSPPPQAGGEGGGRGGACHNFRERMKI